MPIGYGHGSSKEGTKSSAATWGLATHFGKFHYCIHLTFLAVQTSNHDTVGQYHPPSFYLTNCLSIPYPEFKPQVGMCLSSLSQIYIICQNFTIIHYILDRTIISLNHIWTKPEPGSDFSGHHSPTSTSSLATSWITPLSRRSIKNCNLLGTAVPMVFFHAKIWGCTMLYIHFMAML